LRGNFGSENKPDNSIYLSVNNDAAGKVNYMEKGGKFADFAELEQGILTIISGIPLN
jgi:hypothetical protein